LALQQVLVVVSVLLVVSVRVAEQLQGHIAVSFLRSEWQQ
jgi:hypothetical protein